MSGDGDGDGVPEFPQPTAIDDLGGLISFANLENVVKHIIKKFRTVEQNNTNTQTIIEGIKRDIDHCAKNSSVDEVASEFASKFDSLAKALAGQKETVNSVENQLERSRVLCSTIDKKLEACVKEKAVQDRLIRETQDSLQDKVAVAELNMFEAKFAGYATKLEHQELINVLSHYTQIDVTERIAESVKVLGRQFDDYTRTARIEQQLHDLRDWVTDELMNYAKLSETSKKLEEVQMQIRDQALSFERVHAMMDDKIRGMSDRVTSIYTELNNDIQQRALDADLKETQREMRKYALRGETDAFQQDCVPKLKFCVDSIKAFDERLRAQDGAIQRVDEVLLDKAGKYDIMIANSRIEQCYPKERAAAELTRMYERLDWMNKKLEGYIHEEEERANKFRPQDYSATFEQINNHIQKKADRADVVEIYELKANRIDADEIAKLQETIHQQLEYLAATTVGLSKLVLTEANPADGKVLRNHQKQQVLMQTQYLWNWIYRNEPPQNLDTLRAPPTTKKSGDQDKEKRAMDDEKRALLERKIGVNALGASLPPLGRPLATAR